MCHWISATPSLKDHMGVYESLHFLATIKSGQALSDQDIQTALEKMGIAHLGGCLCGQLSAGQKMRVMLALLLLVRRPVWLLDEAGSVLDSKGREILQSIIRFHIRDHKGIVVLASHDTNLFEPDYKLEFGR